MKILLVEDHPFQQKVLLKQLQQILICENDEVQAASSGLEALAIMPVFQPDILVCDLNMPEMDGISFLRHIAEQHFPGHVIITSAASQDVIHSVSKMCANYRLKLLGSLTKPAHTETLSNYIEIARRQMAFQNTSAPSSPVSVTELTEQEVQEAICQKWLQPYFQPIVDLRSGEWVRCEALIRLVHPTLGTITPNRFLPQLSAMGKDAELALLSIHYVTQHLPQFQQRKVAINITSETLVANGFVDDVISLTRQHPALCQQIYFEITESDALKNTGRGLEAASRLGMHGFTLSIDDFGTGYSSLKQLDILPFESLKLDQSFVQALPTSNTAAAIIEASLLLAARLKLTTVAEGIENKELWLQLRQRGCQLAQGYFIAHPMPAAQLQGWHQNWQVRVNNELSLSVS